MIYLTKNFNNFKWDINIINDTWCIYPETVNPPLFKNCNYMQFREFKIKYHTMSIQKLIFVCPLKMITPQKRCEMIFDFMATLTSNIPKDVISDTPFIGEPWKLFWLWQFDNNWSQFGANHSYAIETEWQKWFYRDKNDCLISAKNIKLLATNLKSDLEKINTRFIFNDNFDLFDDNFYQETKEIVFEKYYTPKLIISNFLKLCNNHYGINISFDSYIENKNISVPDNKLYRFVIEENRRRMDIYNELVRIGNENI